MEGRRVFKFGVNAICTSVTELASEAGVAVDDIDHFVFHQANERILSSAVSRLGIDDAKVTRSLAETGNISSACVPLASTGSSVPEAHPRPARRPRGLWGGPRHGAPASCAGSSAPNTSIGRPPGAWKKRRSTNNGRPEHL